MLEILTPLTRFSLGPFGYPRYPRSFEAPLVRAKHSSPPSVKDRVCEKSTLCYPALYLRGARDDTSSDPSFKLLKFVEWKKKEKERKSRAESITHVRTDRCFKQASTSQCALSSAAPLCVCNQCGEREERRDENISSPTSEDVFPAPFLSVSAGSWSSPADPSSEAFFFFSTPSITFRCGSASCRRKWSASFEPLMGL